MHLRDRELFCMEEQFSRSLVGCFGDSSDSVPLLSSLKGWVHARWALKREGGGFKNLQVGWGPFSVQV